MTTKNGIRPGYQSITPYLHVDGVRKLIEFLKQAFGAEELDCHTDADGRVLHAQLRVGDSMVEMADARPEYPAMPIALHYYVGDVDVVYARSLEAGATSLTAPMDMPYGERGASVKDPFGNFWYLATWLD
jgi:uncharacterized glyoxalase superfamily protein PhnB